MTDDADFPDFKPVIEQWRAEYGRIRKPGGGGYWAGWRLEEAAARSKMSPYALGIADHRSMREAIERGGAEIWSRRVEDANAVATLVAAEAAIAAYDQIVRSASAGRCGRATRAS